MTELVLIVAGVLIALGVDEWRADREETTILQQHLVGVTEEINNNLRSLHIMLGLVHPRKIQALEETIAILSQPKPDLDNPDELIRTLIRSSHDIAPWFVQSRFEALKSSESFRSPFSLTQVYLRLVYGHDDRRFVTHSFFLSVTHSFHVCTVVPFCSDWLEKKSFGQSSENC